MGDPKIKDTGKLVLESVKTIKIAGETRFKGKVQFPGHPKKKSMTVFEINGELLAIPTYCPHEQADLSEGKLEGHILECPLHQNKYDLKSGVIKVFSVEMDEDESIYISRDARTIKEENPQNLAPQNKKPSPPGWHGKTSQT